LATLDELVTDIQNKYGSNLVEWIALGTGDGGRRYSYKVYYTESDTSNILRTDIIQIQVRNISQPSEVAYCEKHNYLSTPTTFRDTVNNTASNLVANDTFQFIEVVQFDEPNLRVVAKAIKNDYTSSYYLVKFDQDWNISSTTMIEYIPA
jgi:hypothetical protein